MGNILIMLLSIFPFLTIVILDLNQQTARLFAITMSRVNDWLYYKGKLFIIGVKEQFK